MRMKLLAMLVGMVGLGAAASAFAQMRDENILAGMPDGYRIASQKRVDNMTHVQMIPSDQELENWREMFTVQIFHGSSVELPQFHATMEKNWLSACPKGAHQPVRSGVENGYEFDFWFLTCPNNPQTKQPEATMVKAMRGRDALYVAQKSFKSILTRELVLEWTPFIRNIELCDTRDEKRACPPGF